jgi:hypothetical protein
MNERSIEPRHLWYVFCTPGYTQAINNGDLPDERRLSLRSPSMDAARARGFHDSAVFFDTDGRQ